MVDRVADRGEDVGHSPEPLHGFMPCAWPGQRLIPRRERAGSRNDSLLCDVDHSVQTLFMVLFALILSWGRRRATRLGTSV
jgi:hypothetical protein